MVEVLSLPRGENVWRFSASYVKACSKEAEVTPSVLGNPFLGLMEDVGNRAGLERSFATPQQPNSSAWLEELHQEAETCFLAGFPNHLKRPCAFWGDLGFIGILQRLVAQRALHIETGGGSGLGCIAVGCDHALSTGVGWEPCREISRTERRARGKWRWWGWGSPAAEGPARGHVSGVHACDTPE